MQIRPGENRAVFPFLPGLAGIDEETAFAGRASQLSPVLEILEIVGSDRLSGFHLNGDHPPRNVHDTVDLVADFVLPEVNVEG